MASKHGVIGLTKVLASELAEFGIRVNAIAPGTLRTAMTEQYFHDEDFLTDLSTAVPLGNRGDADDVAQAVAFLASERADFITGVVLPVDGGWGAEKTLLHTLGRVHQQMRGTVDGSLGT